MVQVGGATWVGAAVAEDVVIWVGAEMATPRRLMMARMKKAGWCIFTSTVLLLLWNSSEEQNRAMKGVSMLSRLLFLGCMG